MKPHKKVSTSQHAIDEIPQEILAGIGEIVARWGYLQFQLGVIIREIVNVPKDTGRVLTIGPEIPVLCAMLRTFSMSNHWIKDEGIRADIEALAEDVQKKSKGRNDYAHGVFSYGKKPNEFVRYLMKEPLHRIKPETEILDVANIKQIANDARDLWIRSQGITKRLKAWNKIHSSP